MSDSVTNVDVEDVLSSIRRLVTDTNTDVRPAPKPEPVAEDAAGDEKPSEALLLTPAFRVKADVAEPPQQDESGMGSDETAPDATLDPANLSNLREAISETQKADYYEDDAPEDITPVVDFIRHDSASTQTVEDAFVEEATAEDVPFVWASQREQAADAPQEDMADAGLSEPSIPDWVEAGNAEIAEAEVVETHDDTPDEAEILSQDELHEPHEDHEDDAEQLEDALPEFDTVEGDVSDPDDSTIEPEAVFAAAAAASVFSDTEEQAQSVDDADTSGLAEFEESILDEDALRDMVAEIVREELTGELGERITRNVRKLVRREIHRALLTREFE